MKNKKLKHTILISGTLATILFARNYKSLCQGQLLYKIGRRNISRRAAESAEMVFKYKASPSRSLHRVQASQHFIRGGQANLASSLHYYQTLILMIEVNRDNFHLTKVIIV